MGSATDVIPLRQGTRTGKDGDDFEYVFQARSKPDVARRSLIRSSTTRGRWERATAAVLPDGKVRVTTPADLGRESATRNCARTLPSRWSSSLNGSPPRVARVG
ncbi:MAG TPA: hypothetical protein VFE45_02930 [Coriobacteriia bacterium]|nr:hypothetical protein [Coriobacteriia bacterium]